MKRFRPGCRFEVNGVWYIRFGKEKAIRLGTTKAIKNKRDLELAARPYVNKANADREYAPTEFTVGKAIEEYRKEWLPRREDTRAAYVSRINNHIQPKWEEYPLQEFGHPPSVVADWLNSLDLATRTKRDVKMILGQIMKFCVFKGYLHEAPNLYSITLRKKKGETTRKARVLTVPEFHKMVKHLAEPYKTMSHIAYAKGLRISEVLGLKWQDVDWLNGNIEIRRSVVNQVEDDVKTPKSEAVKPLSKAELEMLKAWRQQSEFTKDRNFIFASPDQAGDLPYSYKAVSLALDHACKDAEIPRITTHSFRHSLRAWLKSIGASAELTTEMMRHTKYDQSRAYGNDGSVPPVVREMNERLMAELLESQQ